MPISYVKISWLNQPSTDTPISQNNLNHMDNQIYALTLEKAELTDIPTLISSLTNDRGYQTASDVAAAISAIGNIQVIKGRVNTYEDLPTSNKSIGDTYFVGLVTDVDMSEYVWTADQRWEKLGKVTAVDLADYYTKEQIDTLFSSKVASTEIKAIKTISGGIAYTLNGTDWVNVISGDDGTTFIPAVSSLGVISWTNDGGYANPDSVNIRGKDLIIKTLYPTLADLQTIHSTGNEGDVYAVGTSTYNELYMWSIEEEEWTNIGSMQNPYTLPVASSTVLGGVKVGATLLLDNGVLNTFLINSLNTAGAGIGALDAAQGYILNNAIAARAQQNHRSTDTIYGLGSDVYYGHVKLINALTASSYLDGQALSAYQGKVLSDAIASKISTSNIIDNLTSTDAAKPLSAYQGKVLNTNKEDKVTITTDSTSTTPTKSLVTNNEYVYSNSAITTLGITLASSYSAGFIASVVFISPSSAPTVTLTNTGSYTIATKGDGTWDSLELTPTASKTVTMMFNYDGINMNVYVSEM